MPPINPTNGEPEAAMATENNNSIQIARLEEQVRGLDKDLGEVRDQLKTVQAQLTEVLDRLSEAKGGWRVLMLMGGAAASAGAAISWIINHVKFMP